MVHLFKISISLFRLTCINEIDHSYFTFCNAELMNGTYQVICFLYKKFCGKKYIREVIREEKMEKTKARKEMT